MYANIIMNVHTDMYTYTYTYTHVHVHTCKYILTAHFCLSFSINDIKGSLGAAIFSRSLCIDSRALRKFSSLVKKSAHGFLVSTFGRRAMLSFKSGVLNPPSI